MYLHLGRDTVVKMSEVVGILTLKHLLFQNYKRIFGKI